MSEKIRRAAMRVQQLTAARAKLAAKCEASPDDPRCEAWTARIAEYDESLARLDAHGVDRPHTGRPVGTAVQAVPPGQRAH